MQCVQCIQWTDTGQSGHPLNALNALKGFWARLLPVGASSMRTCTSTASI